MTQTVPATCVLGPGLTGLTIGLRVLNLDGTTYAAFATTGVAETSTAGTYRKAGGVVAPLAGGYIVWGTALVDYAEATVDSTAVNVTYLKDVALTETGAGYLAAAFKKLFDVATPVLTAASVNQTGDAFARLGAPAGASVSADIADVPTVAEFELRTLPAADYVVVGDTLARVTLVDTTTTNTDMVAAAPSAADVADAVWDEAIAGHADAGSTGAALAGATAPAAADVADAVWDELLAGHVDVGSAGAGLAAAGSAGDPWSTPLPGSYGTGTAGQIIGDTLGGATGTVVYTEGATLDDLLDELASTHGDGSWEGSSAGSGTGSYTDTITDADSNLLDGVRVQLSTDSAGANLAYETYTDALGVFAMRPDPGTYYRWLDLAGYSFTQGVEVTVT